MDAREVGLLLLYAPDDERWASRLQNVLLPLKRECGVSIFEPKQSLAGMDAPSQWQAWLTQSSAVILLISHHFLADERLLPFAERLLAMEPRDRCPLLSVLVGPCAWEASRLHELRPLRVDGRALSEHSHPERAWAELSDELLGALEAIIPDLGRPLAL